MLTLPNIMFPLLISFAVAMLVLPRTLLSEFHNRYRFGAVNRGGRTVSRARYLGGASFVPIFLMTMGFTVLLEMRMGKAGLTMPLQDEFTHLLQLITGMSALFVVGLLDDIIGTSSKVKFLVYLLTACLFPLSGLWINNLYGLFWVYEIPYWVGVPFTVLLVMYLTATINLTDGIEGMATGFCSISLATVIFLSWYAGSYLSCIIACLGLGFTGTFFVLKLMRRKNKGTFLGSSGSMPMGYMICFVILCIYKNKEWHGTGDGVVLAAFCTMLMPAWDMLRVLKSRFVDRRDMTQPDRNLLNHKLYRMGATRGEVQLYILVMNFLFIVMSGFLMNKKVNITLLLLADTVIFFIFHMIINFFISRHEKKEMSQAWEKSYGKANWSEEEVEDEFAELGLQDAAQQILEDEESPKAKIAASTPTMDSIAFIPDGMNSFERNGKRIVDCIIAGGSLIVFSPLFLLCYIAIKLDDHGPAIFRQERIGRFGRPFYIYKFRSMRLDAEKRGPQLSHAGGDEDDRLTKAGRFLRAHHLDELPQLWNVFCGDMAFIGYRPERMFFIKQITEHDPRYYMLYQIRPGVTSYATLYNGYTDTMEKMLTRLELDLYYLKHRSWWFDLKILFLTFWHIVGGKRF